MKGYDLHREGESLSLTLCRIKSIRPVFFQKAINQLHITVMIRRHVKRTEGCELGGKWDLRGRGPRAQGGGHNRPVVGLCTSRVSTTRRVFCCIVITEGGKVP